MKMKIFVFLAISLCAFAAEVKEKDSTSEPEQNKDKRQTQDDFVPSRLIYRTSRKQEQSAPVEEPQENDREPVSRFDSEEYRPGQVFSLNPQELFELQPERRAPLTTSEQLQQLYGNPQQEHRQNLQQIYYIEPQSGRQVGAQNIPGATAGAAPFTSNPQLQQLYSNAQNPIYIVSPKNDNQVGAQAVPGVAIGAAPLSSSSQLPSPYSRTQQDQIRNLQHQILYLNLLGNSQLSTQTTPETATIRTSLSTVSNQVSQEPHKDLQQGQLQNLQPLYYLKPLGDRQVQITPGATTGATPPEQLFQSRQGPQQQNIQQILILRPQLTRQEGTEAPLGTTTASTPVTINPQGLFRQKAQQLFYLTPFGERQVGTQFSPEVTTHAPQRIDFQKPQMFSSRRDRLLQQLFNLDPRNTQVSLQPSHAVIARPHYSSNGGEASVGAALAVSDSGLNSADAYDRELLALLGQPPVRQEERAPAYQSPQVQTSSQSGAPQYQQVSTQSVAPQYQQVDRYITKPSKKPTKQRTKVHSLVSPPQSSSAPQQYLIETTNVQQKQPQQTQLQYRPVPQPQRAPQALRYIPAPSPQAFAQQALYERPETQGLKVVAPPKLQQSRPQVGYRLVTQYQQPEATPKQYRIVETPRPSVRPESRVPAPSIERPVTYLKRFPEPEKMRAVKIYDPVPQEGVSQQSGQIFGEQYYLRPVYRQNDQRSRYELTPLGIRNAEQSRPEPTKPPHSAIYVSKNLAPKKAARPQQPAREQPASAEQVNIEQHGQSLEDQRSQLPPPKNNRAYTPEEFAALVAAGYAVTPIPVAPLGHQAAQSRSSIEQVPAPAQAQTQRRPLYSRRNQYLPLRGDDAP